MNSIIYSRNYSSNGNDSQTDPGDIQFTWLKDQLENCSKNGEKVWLLYHIPPGVDVYSTLDHKKDKDKIESVTLQWKSEYNDQIIEICKTYSTVIQAAFAGHTHMDDFRLILNENEPENLASYVHITPALTPVFGNNPAFQVLNYNRDSFQLISYQTYYLNLNEHFTTNSVQCTWKNEYDFRTTYQKSFSSSSLLSMYQSIKMDPITRMHYINYYGVSITPPEIENSWRGYWGGIEKLTEDDFINWYNIDNILTE